MPWTPPPVETDPDAATRRILAALRDKLPGYETLDGDPVVALAEEIGRETAVLAQATAQLMEEAAAAIGQTVFGLQAQAAHPATVAVRLGVTAAGVVPTLFTVLGVAADGTEVAFQAAEEIDAVPPHVDVEMTAVPAAAVANTVPAGPMRVVTATAIIDTATALAAPAGGADAETRLEYLDRLTSYLSTLRPGGVRATDMAHLARSVPGVHRALGVDLHNPATPGVALERTATVFPVDAAGDPVDSGVAAAVKVTLEAAREVNFFIHVAAPTYTAVDVVFAAVAEPGADPVAVKAAVVDAVTGFLDPAGWGATVADDQAWVNTPAVRYLDLARIAGSAPGVAYLSSLTINGASADLPLSGAAPLPAAVGAPLTPSTVDGTVV